MRLDEAIGYAVWERSMRVSIPLPVAKAISNALASRQEKTVAVPDDK
jgi:hypothetical protein